MELKNNVPFSEFMSSKTLRRKIVGRLRKRSAGLLGRSDMYSVEHHTQDWRQINIPDLSTSVEWTPTTSCKLTTQNTYRGLRAQASSLAILPTFCGTPWHPDTLYSSVPPHTPCSTANQQLEIEVCQHKMVAPIPSQYISPHSSKSWPVRHQK